MKTLKIQLTTTDSVTLTFSDSAQEWDLFSGNVALLDSMAMDAGYNYQNNRERLADWAARNKDLFVKEEKEVTTEHLWNGEELEGVKANNCDSNKITHIVIYHDVDDNPEGFKNIEEAKAWMQAEKDFGDYEMSLMTIEEFKKTKAC